MRRKVRINVTATALTVLGCLVVASACTKEKGERCGNPDSGCAEGLGCVFDGADVTCQPCAESSQCAQFGWCASRAGDCVAVTDAHCQESTMCASHGNCSPRDGKCVATAESCRKTSGCTDFGTCGEREGACAVTSDDDCRASKTCRDTGACRALITRSSAGSCIR